MKADPTVPFETDSGALVEPLAGSFDMEAAFARLAQRPHCLFLDSARRDAALGRYSFLTADPFDYLELPAGGRDALAELDRRIKPFAAATIPGLPPFQGGAAGLVGYDLGRSLERLPVPAIDEFAVPALAVGLYDVVVAIDHATDRAWIISQGFPADTPAARRRRAAERIEQFRNWLAGPLPTRS